MNLTHIHTWIFDLDQTLYPHEAEVMAMVEGKMTNFVMRETGLSRDEAFALQKRYLNEHGTTLAGLMANHGVEPYAFINEVHDVSIDKLAPDLELNALIQALPGRKLVFTNADAAHATRILAKLDMTHLFEAVYHLEHGQFIPKPQMIAFEQMIKALDVDPTRAAFFEDSARNLAPAKALGMTTILVGPHALDTDHAFVDDKALSLKAFLTLLS
jgi:putative hydrolase of the HAD superfamily